MHIILPFVCVCVCVCVLSLQEKCNKKSVQLCKKIQTELVPSKDVILHHPVLIGRRIWSFKRDPKPKQNKGVCHTMALPFYI